VKDTSHTQKYASYLDLYFEIDNGGRLKTSSTTRDDFTFNLAPLVKTYALNVATIVIT
jgi:hypothetical protein